MPIEARSRGADGESGQRAARLFIAVIVAPVAFLLIVFAAMTLPPRLMQVQGDAARTALLSAAPLRRSDLDILAKTRTRALAWRSDAENLDDLASVDLVRAGRHGLDTPAAQPLIQRAIEEQRQALARGPSDPFGWLRLAYLYNYRQPPDAEKSLAALKLALRSGPYEPQLIPSETGMMMRLWDRLDAGTQKQFPFLTRASWRVDPQGLAATAQHNHSIALVEQALADDPQALTRFDALTKN